MTFSVPLAGVGDWLRSEITRGPAAATAVLAGHFAIFTTGGTAIDMLDDAHAPRGVPLDFLDFTRLTWTAACEAVAAEHACGARLVVLLDDVQFVRPALDDHGAAERLGAALATTYLRRHTRLPSWHTRVMAEHRIGTGDILTRSEVQWLFSERELRAALVQQLKAMLRSGDPRAAGLAASADRSSITITDPAYGEYCLVHSGHTNCAGGFVQLLADVHARGVRKLITLVPMRCLGPISMGTALGGRLFGLQGLEVVNVAVPDVSAGLPASVVPAGAMRG
jgi:hypothetical protein